MTNTVNVRMQLKQYKMCVICGVLVQLMEVLPGYWGQASCRRDE